MKVLCKYNRPWSPPCGAYIERHGITLALTHSPTARSWKWGLFWPFKVAGGDFCFVSPFIYFFSIFFFTAKQQAEIIRTEIASAILTSQWVDSVLLCLANRFIRMAVQSFGRRSVRNKVNDACRLHFKRKVRIRKDSSSTGIVPELNQLFGEFHRKNRRNGESQNAKCIPHVLQLVWHKYTFFGN